MLFAIWMAVCCLHSTGQVLHLNHAGSSYDIGWPQYLEDREDTISFATASQPTSQFQTPSLKVPNFLGNLSKAIWYRFSAVNNSHETEWYLEVKGGYMHDLTLYQVDSAGQVEKLALRADGLFHIRPIKSNNLVFPVRLAPGEQKYFYLHANSQSLIRVSMRMCTMQQLYEQSVFSSYSNGVLTGLAVALLIYNLFVFLSLRERVYLYYIGYILVTIIHTNLVAGNLLLFFPWLGGINTTLILPLLAFFSILFTNSFLQTRQYAPFIFTIRRIMMLLCLVPVAPFLLGQYALGITLAAAFMFTLFIYWITAGILAYKNGYSPAIYYIIGFGSLICMNLVFELKILGIVEESYWIDSALYIGSALEAIILSFALASKINFYKKEKEQIQAQAYQQAVNFSRELINMQEAERKRIASELHDSLGQKLILIKNKVLLFLKAEAAGSKVRPDALADTVADAIQEIRTISYGLRPYQIDLLGLTQSVKSLVAESFDAAGIDYELHLDNIDVLYNAEMQMNIYRIVQECINNIVKHARAKKCRVNIQLNNKELSIQISDDGIGFNPDQLHEGFGLRGIRERLQILAGQMIIEPAPVHGTFTRITIPV